MAFRIGTESERLCVVVLHTSASPDVTEWRNYVNAIERKLRADGSFAHVFVATDGGGPDAAQRTELANVVGSRAQTRVFTNSPHPRRMVAAFGWNAGARAEAHSPEAFAEVCSTAGFKPLFVLSMLKALQPDLPPVELLESLTASFQEPKSPG